MIGDSANAGYGGIAIGRNANGNHSVSPRYYGLAIGDSACGTHQGVAVGDDSFANLAGVAVGLDARAASGVAIGLWCRC